MTVGGDAEEHPKTLRLSRLYSIYGKIIWWIWLFREKKCLLPLKNQWNLMSLKPKSYSTEVVLQTQQEKFKPAWLER